MMSIVTFGFGKPTSPAMASESETVDVTRSRSSAPSAISTLVMPTVRTAGVPVRLADIKPGNEPTTARLREASIAVARVDSGSGEKGSESRLPAVMAAGAMRTRVIIRLMLPVVDVDAVALPTTTVHTPPPPSQTAGLTKLTTPS